jgi:predicted RNA-binding Zn ribbon-like protein
VSRLTARARRDPQAPLLTPAAGQLELVRPPAPGQLELVRNFLNTLNVELGVDALDSAESLGAWLRDNGLVERKAALRPTRADVLRVRRVRDALRALAQRNNGIPCECEPAVLEAASRAAEIAMSFDPLTSTSQLRPTAPGVDGALGRIVSAVHGAMADKTWLRLKACADDGCAWIYFDHSKNGCSRWCSAETCGNRSKVKRYRERQAQAAK